MRLYEQARDRDSIFATPYVFTVGIMAKNKISIIYVRAGLKRCKEHINPPIILQFPHVPVKDFWPIVSKVIFGTVF